MFSFLHVVSKFYALVSGCYIGRIMDLSKAPTWTENLEGRLFT